MPKTATTVKQQALEILQDLPDDSSWEQVFQELGFVRMIERGLADSDAGRTVSHEEVGRLIDSWDE